MVEMKEDISRIMAYTFLMGLYSISSPFAEHSKNHFTAKLIQFFPSCFRLKWVVIEALQRILIFNWLPLRGFSILLRIERKMHLANGNYQESVGIKFLLFFFSSLFPSLRCLLQYIRVYTLVSY